MKMPIRECIVVNGREWSFKRRMLDARRIGDIVIVLFDYGLAPRNKQFKNLMAFTLAQKQLWVAEHPTEQVADAYDEIIKEKPLTLWNFAGFKCTVDIKTGRLLKAQFTK